MLTGRGRERERAETPVTTTCGPTGEKPGRSEIRLSSPAPTVPNPATPMRHWSLVVMAGRLVGSRVPRQQTSPLETVHRHSCGGSTGWRLVSGGASVLVKKPPTWPLSIWRTITLLGSSPPVSRRMLRP